MNETSQADTDFYWMQERAIRAEEQVEKLQERADYLQREINKMRRVMQEAGMWDNYGKEGRCKIG